MVITVEGCLSSDEIISLSATAYIKNKLPLILWDISRGSVYSISETDVRKVASEMRHLREISNGGKTALVAGNDADYGILRMYEVHASAQNAFVEYGAFRDVEEARNWILA